VIQCVKGNITDPLRLVGSAHGNGVANAGLLEEQKLLIHSVEEHQRLRHHDHDHAHSTAVSCTASDCMDPSHNHDHHHDHNEHEHHHSSCTSSSIACNDPTHDHSHGSHQHSQKEHSHQSSFKGAAATTTTAQQRFGISSFVYRRRRPFHPIRFSQFLRGIEDVSISGLGDLVVRNNDTILATSSKAAQANHPQKALIRSKGFVWMATSKSAAYFLSHAGQFIEISALGRWWADINRKDWPLDMEQDILADYPEASSGAASGSVIAGASNHGDRRQEIVLIGQFARDHRGDPTGEEDKITRLLDSCLLTDDEMTTYEKISAAGGAAVNDNLRSAFIIPE
jgi:G3E family GTPase